MTDFDFGDKVIVIDSNKNGIVVGTIINDDTKKYNVALYEKNGYEIAYYKEQELKLEEDLSSRCFICNVSTQFGDLANRATIWRSSGNYGSTIFDPGNCSYIEIHICDTCLLRNQKSVKFYSDKASNSKPWIFDNGVTKYKGEVIRILQKEDGEFVHEINKGFSQQVPSTSVDRALKSIDNYYQYFMSLYNDVSQENRELSEEIEELKEKLRQINLERNK